MTYEQEFLKFAPTVNELFDVTDPEMGRLYAR